MNPSFRRSTVGAGVILAAALLFLVIRAAPTESPGLDSAFGWATIASPTLIVAPELRP